MDAEKINRKIHEWRGKSWYEVEQMLNEHATLTAQPAESIPELMQAYAEQYDAGAASVDRRAIVREAFKKVMRQAKKGGHLVIQLSVLAKQMDAILAEMGGEE